MYVRGQCLYYDSGNTTQVMSILLNAINLDPDNTKIIQFRKKKFKKLNH